MKKIVKIVFIGIICFNNCVNYLHYHMAVSSEI